MQSKTNGIVDSLSEKEGRLLNILERVHKATIEDIESKHSMQYADISRSALWLENKGLVKIIKTPVTSYLLTDAGNAYAKNGLPERRIFDYLLKADEASAAKIKGALNLADNEFEGAIGFLRRNNTIEFKKIDNKSTIALNQKSDIKIKETEKAMESPNDKKNVNVIADLVKRGILKKEEKNIIEIEITDLGIQVSGLAGAPGHAKLIESLTPSIIASKSWQGKKFRIFDIKSQVPLLKGGREHPLYWMVDIVKENLLSMGFRELDGDWIETTFWNMDSMFIPQNHPARDVNDTFYIVNEKGKLPKDLKLKVKKVHETGWDTGSTGYMQEWKEEEAMKLALRSHTTALTFRTFASGISLPDKAFTIGKVFRNENPDAMHMAEFHQIEGFVADTNINMRDMIGYFTEFYKTLGITGLKFKPTYNPYTEPSLEIYAKHMGRLIEIGNSGMFRPEALRPYDIKANVIAWGLALERLASIVFDIKDIRELYGSNSSIEFARGYKYKPYKSD